MTKQKTIKCRNPKCGGELKDIDHVGGEEYRKAAVEFHGRLRASTRRIRGFTDEMYQGPARALDAALAGKDVR